MPFSKSYNRLLDEHLHILIAQGNHEAYLKLKERYLKHAEALSKEILEQYQGSGVIHSELVSICNHCFLYVVKKYDPQLCSFYTFWKSVVEQSIIDYFVDNSYLANARAFYGYLHFGEELDERKMVEERISENDTYLDEKRLKELKKVIFKHKDEFKPREFMILNMYLQGYDVKDLEHTKLFSRSVLYLTFNSACNKLKSIIEKQRKKY